ncbi:MAG: FtsX-like permease family protein [Devosia sp.]
MRGIWTAIRIGLLDMRGDFRRFGMLIVCLAVGTALIAGVSSVGASIKQAVEQDAAILMGGDLELSRDDRPANAGELAKMATFGRVSTVIETNVRAEWDAHDAFVDLVSVGNTYPLLGKVSSPQLPAEQKPFDFLGLRDGSYGALVDPVMLDQLGIKIGDIFQLGGTPFQARGALGKLPDSAVRGFRLGLTALISTDGFATLSDMTSPLPGLGTLYRYKLLPTTHGDGSLQAAVVAAIGDAGWTIRTPSDGLGPMVHYYDLFMRFLVIVGLASLLIGGVSVWTGISAYVSERANVIAVMRSIGAERARIFVHFFAQVTTLALIGVGLGLLVGASIGFLVLPVVAQSIGVNLPNSFHAQPLLVAAAIGLVTAFAFSYLPLQQALNIKPMILFRSKGLASPPFEWRTLVGSVQVIPVILAAAAFIWLAIVMTNDLILVCAFALVSAIAVILFRLAIGVGIVALRSLQESANPILRRALRAISGSNSDAPSVVISVGMALATLIVVLVLEVNLSNEYLGASVFDAPTFVASDLFKDEAATLRSMQAKDSDIVDFTATPMLRGSVTSVGEAPASSISPRGPEALFLLSGDIPLTYRQELPSTSKLVEGKWWPPDYQGEPLVSLHESLRSGLGIKLGDKVSFNIFGDTVTATVANFRDYSWQGGIDFLVTFSPGALEGYPATLLGAVTAAAGHEDAVQRSLATALPDVRFIAIGETLKQITSALGQLSLAASLVGGLAVGNGLLVLIGSLAAGRQQRRSDAVITKVLGASRFEVIAALVVQYLLLAAFAAVLATAFGIAIAWILTMVLLDVDFALNGSVLAAVDAGAIAIVGLLGATTVLSALRTAPARLLRAM